MSTKKEKNLSLINSSITGRTESNNLKKIFFYLKSKVWKTERGIQIYNTTSLTLSTIIIFVKNLAHGKAQTL